MRLDRVDRTSVGARAALKAAMNVLTTRKRRDLFLQRIVAGFVFIAEVAGIDDKVAAGFFQLRQHFVRGVAGSNRTVPLNAQRLVNQQLAQIHDPLFLGGEQIVVHVDVIDAELVAQILHVIVGVLRRIGLVEALKHRAVAEGAGVGAAARGDHRCTGRLDIRKKRQVVIARESP